MTFTLSIDTDNAAFGDDDPSTRSEEIKRILRELIASSMLDGIMEADGGSLRDVNGNRVGSWGIA